MKKQNQAVVLKKVLRYVRPYALALITSLLLALVFVAMSLYIPILVGEGIDLIIVCEAAAGLHLCGNCSAVPVAYESDQQLRHLPCDPRHP